MAVCVCLCVCVCVCVEKFSKLPEKKKVSDTLGGGGSMCARVCAGVCEDGC